MTAPREERIVVARAEELLQRSTRRRFLRTLGIGGTLVLLPSVFTACDDTDEDGGVVGVDPRDNVVQSVTLDLRTDLGILNFTYLNEQIEATFYNAAVTSAAFGTLSAEAREVLQDIRAVENIHREFFAAALGSNRVGRIALNQQAVAAAVATGASILRTAEMLEDNGVATLNGAGKYLQSADNLLIAGKAVSVEARHAAALRDLREAAAGAGGIAGAVVGTRFAGDDIVVPSGALAGLDVKIEPGVSLQRIAATGLVAGTISVTNPPATKPGTPDLAPPMPTP